MRWEQNEFLLPLPSPIQGRDGGRCPVTWGAAGGGQVSPLTAVRVSAGNTLTDTLRNHADSGHPQAVTVTHRFNCHKYWTLGQVC